MKLLFASTLLLTAVALTSCSKKPANETAPAIYRVNFDLSTGPVVIEVTRANAPLGADRFYNLVKAHYFDGNRFFRVVPDFIVQWGIAGDPAVAKTWDVPVQDDPVKTTNAKGTIVFAAAGANTRTTQLFFNLVDNGGKLDGQGFAPFGKVVSGLDAIARINPQYGQDPDQGRIEKEGNTYLQQVFPNLDYIKTATLAP